MTNLPPEAPGPNPGQAGHYAHHDWLTASVKALDGAVQGIDRDDRPFTQVNWVGDWNGNMWWARKSGVVTIIANVGKGSVANSGDLMCTLPPEARPLDFSAASSLVMLFVGQSGGGVRTIYIDVMGNVYIGEGQPANPGIWGSWSYIGATVGAAVANEDPPPAPGPEGFGG